MRQHAANRGSLLAAVVVLGLVLAAPLAAGTDKLNVATGKMFQGLPIEPGETTCHGGVWYGVPFACSPGTRRISVRNVVTGWFLAEPAGPAAAYLPNVAYVPGQPGPVKFGLNCNLDESLTGECWGTVEMTVGPGQWVGVWSGKFDLVRLVGDMSLTAHGQGSFAGLTLKLDAMGPATGADFYYLARIVNARQ